MKAILKNYFYFGCKRQKAKLESAYSFMLEYPKITVWNCIATCIGNIYLHSMMSFPIVLMVYPMSHHQLYLLAVKGLASWVGWQFTYTQWVQILYEEGFSFFCCYFYNISNPKKGPLVNYKIGKHFSENDPRVVNKQIKRVDFVFSFFNPKTKNVIEDLQNDMMK